MFNNAALDNIGGISAAWIHFVIFGVTYETCLRIKWLYAAWRRGDAVNGGY